MRLVWLAGSFMLALLIAVLSLQTPRPAPTNAPAAAFSAARAMADVREIARRPHPLGSHDHARVQAYLLGRMRALGLEVSTQSGPLSPRAIRYLEHMGGDASAAGFRATNLIGVLPGGDPRLPMVALMAHYDTVPRSPGAADDTAGVAAVLEAVRALKARGPNNRSLVVILTDSEELGLDGARVFFGGHPLRDRIGAVVNLEARGGGGRAIMFETGRDNAAMIDLFAHAGARAAGGMTSNSLAVWIYEVMPNDTDFSVPKARGTQGVNFAFIGRPAQYHTARSTPGALDQGSLQHIGSQALETASALLDAPRLPRPARNVVYADLFGWVIVSHPPGAGWGLLIVMGGLAGLAFWRARSRAGVSAADVARGSLDGLWYLAAAVALATAACRLAGPTDYYTLLARTPWLEGAACAAAAGVALVSLAGRGRLGRWVPAGVIAVAVLAAVVLGGLDFIMLGAAVVAIGLSLVPGLSPRTVWGAWIGLIGLVFLLGLGAQAQAPAAGFLFLWPGLLVAVVAAVAAFADPSLLKLPALAPIAAAAAVGGAWLLTLLHPVFLGVGMLAPGVVGLLALLVLMFLRPLSPERGSIRGLMVAASALLLVGAGLSLAARVAEPAPAAQDR